MFNNFDIEGFIDRHLFKTNPHEDIDETTLSVYSDIPVGTKVVQGISGTTKNRTTIYNKCRYLQDAIIRMANSNEDKVFSLNAELLKRVIGDDYLPMLEVFSDMGYIKKGDGIHNWHYRIGSASTLYTLIETEIHLTAPFINKAIQKYKEKTETLLENMRNTMSKRVGTDFIKKYLVSLSYIQIEDRQGFDKKVKELVEEQVNRELYYNYLTEELGRKKKVIQKIDGSGRMYHVLTNMKKELRQYLNIDFSLDCKNSHPLLINYFLFRNKNISLYSSYTISNSIIDIYNLSFASS